MSIKEEGVRSLVRHFTQSVVTKNTSIEKVRGKNAAHDQKLMVFLEALGAFPDYELWLWKGEADPRKGQISPTYAAIGLEFKEETLAQ